jgi:hypothetical protein
VRDRNAFDGLERLCAEPPADEPFSIHDLRRLIECEARMEEIRRTCRHTWYDLGTGVCAGERWFAQTCTKCNSRRLVWEGYEPERDVEVAR